jgi:hypothetical protein
VEVFNERLKEGDEWEANVLEQGHKSQVFPTVEVIAVLNPPWLRCVESVSGILEEGYVRYHVRQKQHEWGLWHVTATRDRRGILILY